MHASKISLFNNTSKISSKGGGFPQQIPPSTDQSSRSCEAITRSGTDNPWYLSILHLMRLALEDSRGMPFVVNSKTQHTCYKTCWNKSCEGQREHILCHTVYQDQDTRLDGKSASAFGTVLKKAFLISSDADQAIAGQKIAIEQLELKLMNQDANGQYFKRAHPFLMYHFNPCVETEDLAPVSAVLSVNAQLVRHHFSMYHDVNITDNGTHVASLGHYTAIFTDTVLTAEQQQLQKTYRLHVYFSRVGEVLRVRNMLAINIAELIADPNQAQGIEWADTGIKEMMPLTGDQRNQLATFTQQQCGWLVECLCAGRSAVAKYLEKDYQQQDQAYSETYSEQGMQVGVSSQQEKNIRCILAILQELQLFASAKQRRKVNARYAKYTKALQSQMSEPSAVSSPRNSAIKTVLTEEGDGKAESDGATTSSLKHEVIVEVVTDQHVDYKDKINTALDHIKEEYHTERDKYLANRTITNQINNNWHMLLRAHCYAQLICALCHISENPKLETTEATFAHCIDIASFTRCFVQASKEEDQSNYWAAYKHCKNIFTAHLPEENKHNQQMLSSKKKRQAATVPAWQKQYDAMERKMGQYLAGLKKEDQQFCYQRLYIAMTSLIAEKMPPKVIADYIYRLMPAELRFYLALLSTDYPNFHLDDIQVEEGWTPLWYCVYTYRSLVCVLNDHNTTSDTRQKAERAMEHVIGCFVVLTAYGASIIDPLPTYIVYQGEERLSLPFAHYVLQTLWSPFLRPLLNDACIQSIKPDNNFFNHLVETLQSCLNSDHAQLSKSVASRLKQAIELYQLLAQIMDIMIKGFSAMSLEETENKETEDSIDPFIAQYSDRINFLINEMMSTIQKAAPIMWANKRVLEASYQRYLYYVFLAMQASKHKATVVERINTNHVFSFLLSCEHVLHNYLVIYQYICNLEHQYVCSLQRAGNLHEDSSLKNFLKNTSCDEQFNNKFCEYFNYRKQEIFFGILYDGLTFKAQPQELSLLQIWHEQNKFQVPNMRFVIQQYLQSVDSKARGYRERVNTVAKRAT